MKRERFDRFRVTTEATSPCFACVRARAKRTSGPRLRKALVDGGYAGAPMADLGRGLGIEVKVARTEKGKGFQVVARRWVVERTFAWLVKRRLRVDHEEQARTGVAWMQAAMVRLWPGGSPTRHEPQTVSYAPTPG